MPFFVFRAHNDCEVATRVGPDHEITTQEITRRFPKELLLAKASGMIVLPKAVRQLRTSKDSIVGNCLQEIQSATRQGVGLINLVNGALADRSHEELGAHALTSDLKIPILHLPREHLRTTDRILIEPLDRYLKKYAYFSMLTPDFRQFLPLQVAGHTVALRSTIHRGGCEMLLPIGRRLPTDSLLDLVEILRYFQSTSRNPANSHWNDKFALFCNQADLGIVTAHERDRLHQDPGCFDYLLDVAGQKFFRRLGNGAFDFLNFAKGQVMSIVGLFAQPGTWLPCHLGSKQYVQADGTPFQYDSNESFRVQRNAAIRIVNQLEPLIRRKGTRQRPEYCLDPGARTLGLLIPKICLGSAPSTMPS